MMPLSRRAQLMERSQELHQLLVRRCLLKSKYM
jgi:hypothetical protein